MQGSIGNFVDAFILSLILYTQSTFTLYEDQIGKFDWHQNYIGFVTHVFVGKVLDSSKHIILATEQNILASLKLETGEIVWRHILESGREGHIEVGFIIENKLITLLNNYTMIRVWNVLTSFMIEEIMIQNTANNIQQLLYDENSGYILSKKMESIMLHSIPRWKLIWETTYNKKFYDPHLYINRITNMLNIIDISLEKQLLSFVSFNLKNGTIISELISIDENFSKYTIIKDGMFFICLLDNKKIYVFHSQINNLKYFSYTLEQNIIYPLETKFVMKLFTPVLSHISFIFIHDLSNKIFEIYQIILKKTQSHQYDMSFMKIGAILENVQYFSFNTDKSNQIYVFTLSPSKSELKNPEALENQIVELNTYVLTYEKWDSTLTKRTKVLLSLPNLSNILSFLVTIPTDDYDTPSKYSVLIRLDDYSLMLISKGKIKWVREEALAYIENIEMLDLPIANKHALTSEQGYLESSVKHPFIPFRILCRIYYQVIEIFDEISKTLYAISSSKLYSNIIAGGGFTADWLTRKLNKHKEHPVFSPYVKKDLKFAQYFPSANDKPFNLYRDQFNLRKLILVTTKISKIFALDSQTGKILYSIQLRYMIPFQYALNVPDRKNIKGDEGQFLFYLLRSSSHFPSMPKAIIIGRDSKNISTRLVCFNPISGYIIDDLSFDFDIKQAMQLSVSSVESEFVKPVIILDEKYKVHVYPPNLVNFVKDYIDKIYIYTTEPSNGVITGFKLGSPQKSHLIDEIENQTSSIIFVAWPIWNLNLFFFPGQRVLSITSKKPNGELISIFYFIIWPSVA
ncbi:unnamed protein product [Gordionus sp. m RMFG-2023]